MPIPRHLHFIWIQGEEALLAARPEFEAYRRAWERYLAEDGRWTLRVWADAEIREVVRSVEPKLLRVYKDDAVPWAARADIARYCIVYRHGGVYADVSTRPIRAPAFMWRDVDFAFSHRELTHFEKAVLSPVNNHWFASVASHEVLRRMIDGIAAAPSAADRPFLQSVEAWVQETTGPAAWWRAVRPSVSDPGVRALPYAMTDPITLSGATVDPDVGDKAARELLPDAVLVHNGRESWMNAVTRGVMLSAKTVRDHWPYFLMAFLGLAIILAVSAIFLTRYMKKYRSCCEQAKGCKGGECLLPPPKRKQK